METKSIYSISEEWRNTGHKPMAFDFAEALLFFCLLYPVSALILQLAHAGAAAFLSPFLLLAGLALSTLSRLKIRRLSAMTALELLLCAAVTYAAGTLAARIVLGVFIAVIAICTLRSAYLRIRREDLNSDLHYHNSYNLYLGDFMPAVASAVCYPVFMVALFFGLTGSLIAVAVCYALFLAVFECYRHFSGAQTLINGGYGRSEARKLRGVSRTFAAGVLAAVGLLTGLTLVIYRFAGLYRLDSALLTALTASRPQIPPQVQPIRQNPSPSGTGTPDLAKIFGAGKTNPYLEWIFDCMAYLLIAAIAVLIVVTLVKQLRRFAGMRRSRDEVRQSVFSLSEAVKTLRVRAARPFAAFGGKPNNIRVRRAYHRLISRLIRRGLPIRPSDTPGEIENRLTRAAGEADARAIYEKARYSSHECTEAEVDAMRRASADLRRP